MPHTDLSKCSTYELLNELHSRRMWFYTWSPETIKQDFASFGMEPPTDEECVDLCELMEDAIDDTFFNIVVDSLKVMRAHE